MSAEGARSARAFALQDRICGLHPPLPPTPEQLLGEVRKCLWAAVDEGVLRTRPEEIQKLLRISSEDQPDGCLAIFGGKKNQKRDPALPHFARDDGAWFDFAITVSHRRGMPLVLLAYNFEIRFPQHESPRWVRFDLNSPGHANQDDGLRSHIHPGSDDLQAPAPFMSPLEILDVLIHGLRLAPTRKPRAG